MNTERAVLFISHDASRTGAPIFLLRFLEWFRRNRPVSFRILIGDSGALVPEFESLGPVDSFEPESTTAYRILRRLKLNGRRRAMHLSSLREKLAQSNIGLIYSNTIGNGEILDFLSFLNCPVICHVHELDSAIHDRGAKNLDLVKKEASAYIAVSQAVKTNLVCGHGIPQDKVKMIHGFVPILEPGLAQRKEARAAVCMELGIPMGSKLVCTCGSIERRKGTDLFLEVARHVAEGYAVPVHFVWVGDGPERSGDVRRKVESMSMQRFVHFVGHRSDVSTYYDASDLFLLTSREDPFPLVVLEAASWGKPIICFDNAGGAPEFVGRDAGFVVPGFDVRQMASRTIDLLRSDDLRNRMGAAARKKVSSRHNLSAGASEIAAMIDSTLLDTVAH